MKSFTEEMATRYCVAYESGSEAEKDVDAITEWLMDKDLWQEEDEEVFEGWEEADFRRLAFAITKKMD